MFGDVDFLPFIGENPCAPSFGELFFFLSAVSPQTGDEGFFDFGVKYENRVAMFTLSREEFSRASLQNQCAWIIFYLFPDSQSAIKDGEERDEPRELESRVGEAGGVKKWEKPVDEV